MIIYLRKLPREGSCLPNTKTFTNGNVYFDGLQFDGKLFFCPKMCTEYNPCQKSQNYKVAVQAENITHNRNLISL